MEDLDAFGISGLVFLFGFFVHQPWISLIGGAALVESAKKYLWPTLAFLGVTTFLYFTGNPLWLPAGLGLFALEFIYIHSKRPKMDPMAMMYLMSMMGARR